ncbi:cell division control protein 45 homolog [Octopus sinensis]|uniref:Cell division control protein 45 homolog n=1 Tax=Octopus sinensis TaxID=2607531 RepID=A0A6P7TW60_9MOLL|nr:cell division control protein 45 homolog [Octopus sinensis]
MMCTDTQTALLMFELSWKLSKDSKLLLWYAVVGCTEQFLTNKVVEDKYMEAVIALQSHALRLNNRSPPQVSGRASETPLTVTFRREMNIVLYRHWSLFESLWHTLVPASVFGIWKINGRKRFYEFFAQLGLGGVVDWQDSSKLETLMETHMPEYRLENCGLFMSSFTIRQGYGSAFAASDHVHILSSVLSQSVLVWVKGRRRGCRGRPTLRRRWIMWAGECCPHSQLRHRQTPVAH